MAVARLVRLRVRSHADIILNGVTDILDSLWYVQA